MLQSEPDYSSESGINNIINGQNYQWQFLDQQLNAAITRYTPELDLSMQCKLLILFTYFCKICSRAQVELFPAETKQGVLQLGHFLLYGTPQQVCVLPVPSYSCDLHLGQQQLSWHLDIFNKICCFQQKQNRT